MQDTIDALRIAQRYRARWMRGRAALVNQIKAARCSVYGVRKVSEIEPTEENEKICEEFTFPFRAAKDILDTHIKAIEKQIARSTAQLPVAEWWASHRGMNVLGLAQIVGEAGDLGAYRNPSCLWKRFGLHVTEDGRAPRPEKGKEIGYSPRRRSVVKMIGDPIIRSGNDAEKIKNGVVNPYRVLYDERKVYEAGKAPDLKPIQHHLRAMRYMEKRILRDLWCRWRNEEPRAA